MFCDTNTHRPTPWVGLWRKSSSPFSGKCLANDDPPYCALCGRVQLHIEQQDGALLKNIFCKNGVVGWLLVSQNVNFQTVIWNIARKTKITDHQLKWITKNTAFRLILINQINIASHCRNLSVSFRRGISQKKYVSHKAHICKYVTLKQRLIYTRRSTKSHDKKRGRGTLFEFYAY